MLPKLTFKSYFANFSSFLLEPKQAKENDRIKAVGISILIGVFTLGLAHAITKIYKACHQTPEDLKKIDEKVQEQSKNIIRPNKNSKEERQILQTNERSESIVPQNLIPQQPKVDSSELPPKAETLGLTVSESNEKYKNVSEQNKYAVRDKTKAALGKFPDNFSDLLAKVKLFASKKSANTFNKNTQMLGRFDVLVTPVKMDFTDEWVPSQSENKEFFVHHAASINIGERRRKKGSTPPEDLKDYSVFNNKDKTYQLDEARFLKDLEEVFHNILFAQNQTPPDQKGLKQAVWFPFGMGAFLRYLPDYDTTYDPQKMAELKFKIAQAFVRQTKNFPELEIHLCLPYAPMDSQFLANHPKSSLEYFQNLEINQNYNAFVQALAKAPDVKNKILLHINCDATHVAQNLANQNPNGSYQVSLTNGANRNLIGNHWMDNHALVAIDENLHRRSLMAAQIAYSCNAGPTSEERPQNYLEDRVTNTLKGTVIPVT